MARCIVFCAAEFDRLLDPIHSDDYVIAADGGVRHTERLGLVPNAILGDFDSLGYVPEGSQVFPIEKDDTDAMLALRHGLDRGFREFYLYGSLDGPRLDHTLANCQALQYLCDRDAFGYLIGKEYLLTVVKDGTLRFPAGCQGTVSIFCFGPEANGVTLKGLYYGLEDGTLTPGFPLGVSNHFTGKESTITVREGSLLVIWDRKVGFPRQMPLQHNG